MNQYIVENALRNTYNLIWGRRNPRFAKWYDVYLKKPTAKEHFRILAKRLVKEKIDPVMYIGTMSTYGKWGTAKFLPQPKWLAKKSTIKIYAEWFLNKKLACYDNQPERTRKGLLEGIEIKPAEVLNRLKWEIEEGLKRQLLENEDYINHTPKWNEIKPEVLFWMYNGGWVSEWYVALREDFEEFIPFLQKERKQDLKTASLFYKYHEGTRKEAEEMIR